MIFDAVLTVNSKDWLYFRVTQTFQPTDVSLVWDPTLTDMQKNRDDNGTVHQESGLFWSLPEAQ